MSTKIREVLARLLAASMVIAVIEGGMMAALHAEQASPVGLWLTENGEGAIEIFWCGKKLCGNLVWMGGGDSVSGAVSQAGMHDRRSARPDRSLCGLNILRDFTPEDDGKTYGGHVYNPRDGHIYTAEMIAESANILKLRGYLLISLLGQTQHWTRAPAEFQQRCRLSSIEQSN